MGKNDAKADPDESAGRPGSVVWFDEGGYWKKYRLDDLPVKGIPLLPELLNAALALVTALGLFRATRRVAPSAGVP